MSVSANTKSRRAKGEQTRRQILQATLRVIAQQGYRALTHRAVAKEAGVNLSLTTYYFKDLGEMVAQAFTLYKDELRQEADLHWREVFAYLDQFSDAMLTQESIRREVVEKLAWTLTQYIENHVRNGPEGVAVEMTFFFDLHLDEAQRELAYKLRSRFLKEFVQVCRRLGSSAPETDAELIMGTLHRLESEAVAVPRMHTEETTQRQIQRLLDALIGGVEG